MRRATKLDAFTHILPAAYAQRMSALADTPAARNIRQRISGVPALVDVDLRLRQLEEFGEDYRQIISLPAPPLEDIGDATISRDMARLANDGLAELVAARPERFAGAHPVAAAEERVAAGDAEPIQRVARTRHTIVTTRPSATNSQPV